MLLPHEVVSSFLHEGETRRMTGPDTWFFQLRVSPTQTCHSKHQFYCGSFAWSNWGPISVLGTLQGFAVVSTASRIIRVLAHKLLLDVMKWNSNKNQINFSKPQSEDPSTELKHVIPIRLFGDGAEAQRILVQPCLAWLSNPYMLHGLTWPK